MLLPEPTTHYVNLIDVGCRLRVQIWNERPHVRFAIALEYEWADDDWRRIACWDNWGGKVHRDRYRPDRSDYAHHEPVYDSADTHQAITWVFKDIHDNYERYVKDFRLMGVPIG